MTDKSSVIFGNPISKKAIKKAAKSKKKFAKKYGDDSAADYKVKLVPNVILNEPLGVYDIRVDEGEGDLPFDTEKGIIVGNIRMGFGHYRISIAMASAAHALGYTPYWMNLNSYPTTTCTKVISAQNDLYSMGSRLSQKSKLFNKKYWEPLNYEGFRQLTYNAGDQKNAELMAPVYKNVPKEIPVIGTHVWPAQAAIHAGMQHVVNAIPDNWPMALHFAEGSVHTIQTHQSYIGYRILNGMQEKDVLKPMPAESLVYTGHYIDHELVANLEADCDARMKRKADDKPMRFLLTIGGAGAQRELFEAIIKHLLPLIKEKKAALYVNVGDYKKVWETLCKRIKGLKDISTEHFKKQPRPILLNGWEACYFNISESTLLDLASIGKEIGIEMLVMDDGWFGERNDDEHSLGDWDANPKKLPHGLKGLGDKLAAKGMKFGIWVEPEMFNRHSKLYEQHPEWSIAIPGAHQSEGRKQRILDLANPEVVRYITDKMTEVFSSAKIDYVKWDMNRIFSDVYSQYLPAGRQGETAHRYICGLYKMMDELTRRFPDILFEGCASGGNRFDLGILSYFPQIWASDNTDALSRAYIQEGYSYGYPQSTYTAHVAASPNHQTLRVTTPETRFGVASFGVLGYECDVRDLSGDMKKKLAAQIELYKKLREVLQFGQFYRIRSGNVHEWVCVSPDKTQAVGMMLQELVQPNTQAERFFARGLDPQKTYHFYNVSQRVDVKQFGSLVNTLSPIHIKQDSMMHNIVAKAVKLKGEAEDVTATGEVLMSTGVALKPAFSGTGFNENVRVYPDFSLRIYFMESKANAE